MTFYLALRASIWSFPLHHPTAKHHFVKITPSARQGSSTKCFHPLALIVCVPSLLEALHSKPNPHQCLAIGSVHPGVTTLRKGGFERTAKREPRFVCEAGKRSSRFAEKFRHFGSGMALQGRVRAVDHHTTKRSSFRMVFFV